jgi:hypothetical protein
MTRRCPNCGGLVSVDAQWCGQCLTRFDRSADPAPQATGPPRSPVDAGPGAAPSPPTPSPEGDRGPRIAGGPAPIRSGDQGIVWECPTCHTENPIEAATCRGCGAPFTQLFSEEEARPTVAPGRVVGLSLLFPGLGHLAAGRAAEGIARAVVFGYALATVVTLLVARAGQGLGPFLPLFLISATAGVVLYAMTAIDAGRLARGEEQVLTTRALLYGAVGLMVLTVVVLVILGARVGPRG